MATVLSSPGASSQARGISRYTAVIQRRIPCASAAAKAALTFLPLLAVIKLLWTLIAGDNDSVLYYFNRIQGNDFVLADVLFACMFASYVTILFGLAIYLSDVMRGLDEHRGSDRTISVLSRCAVIVLGVVALALILYVVFVLLACFSVDLYGPLNLSFETFLRIDRWLSVGVFALFCAADLVLCYTQRRQRRQNLKELGSADQEELKRILKTRIRRNRALSEFSMCSVKLVNLPTLIVNCGMICLVEALERSDSLHWKVDGTLHFLRIEHLETSHYLLFLDGLEAGVITATIIFSQLVYATLKYRYERAEGLRYALHT